MRIGVFGGTFNPIHLGHTNLINGFYKYLSLEKMIIIPTNVPPHKTSENLVSSEHRVAMCKLALENFSNCEISDIEIKRLGKSYTVDTLKELKGVYPNSEFFLLMGEDMFLTVQKWKNSSEIFKYATICATPRNVDDVCELEKHAEKLKNNFEIFNSEIINIPLVKISSTEIREGKTNLLDTKVYRYILENKLYDWSETP